MDTRQLHSLCFLIILPLIAVMNKMEAQTPVSRLDQPMLMKQLIGTWRNEFAPDTSIIWEIKAYGKGLEAHYRFTTKGQTYREVKQLIGFDSGFEAFITYTLFRSGRFVLFTGEFTSDDQMHVEVRDRMNSEKTLSQSEYDFESPDRFTVRRIFGNYGAKPGTYCRIKT